jgi:hypothetical protein
MRTLLLFGALSAVLVAAGCAFPSERDRVDPNGSYADAQTGNVVESMPPMLVTSPPSGRLLVYVRGEGTTIMASGKSGLDTSRPRYSIYDESGRYVREVVNAVATAKESPEEVALTPGRYLVKVGGVEPSHPVFWVGIQVGRRSIVDVPKLCAGYPR